MEDKRKLTQKLGKKKGGLQNNSMIISFFPLEYKVNPKEKNLKEGENSQGNGFTCKS